MVYPTFLAMTFALHYRARPDSNIGLFFGEAGITKKIYRKIR